jgi:hypothetical protein
VHAVQITNFVIINNSNDIVADNVCVCSTAHTERKRNSNNVIRVHIEFRCCNGDRVLYRIFETFAPETRRESKKNARRLAQLARTFQ